MLALLLVGLLLASPVAPPDTVAIEEWKVPWEGTRPRDPYVGPDGMVWFVGQRGNYVGRLDPATGAFTRYDLPAGAYPHNVIVDERGRIWYAGNGDGHVGRLNPADSSVMRIDMPPEIRDPHTLVRAPDGTTWFTAQGSNAIVRMQNGQVAIAEVRTPRARPYGIKLAADGTPWVALFGTNKLARVDPRTTAIEEIVLPRPEARPRRLEVTDDGVWYVDYAAGYLGRLDPATGAIDEWRLPYGAESQPYGTAADAHGRIWIVQSGPQPNMLVGFDPATERFFAETRIPGGGGTVRHMYFHAPSGEVWFGTDRDTIGRARVMDVMP